MEKKINVAELLKDCPNGMELDCTIFENLEFDHIDKDNGAYNIICRVKSGWGYYNTHTFTEYGCYSTEKYSKCVIFPKGKTTWEGFQKTFEDGDIVFTHANCLKVGLGNTWISIFQEKRNGGVATYVDYAEYGSDFYADKDKGLLCMNEDIMRQRLATEEEKQRLFQAIKDNGYKWNAETKTLEKLIEPKFKVGDIVQNKDAYKVRIIEVNIEDEYFGYISIIAKGLGSISFSEQDNWELVPNKFDITTLKPFQSRVLTRITSNNVWGNDFFGYYKDGLFHCIGHCAYRYCIPFEGNQHLLGTTDDCDEYYKTWE